MIILEGPDGAGKTTLAKRLAEELELEYRRYDGLSSTLGPTDEGIVNWWYEQMRNDPLAIYDRCFWISERMYQPATPGRKLTVNGQTMMGGLNRLYIIEPVIIFCLPPVEVTLANVHAHERERLQGVDDEALRKIYWSYWGEFAMWQLLMDENIFQYDFTNQYDRQEIVMWIQDKVQHEPV